MDKRTFKKFLDLKGVNSGDETKETIQAKLAAELTSRTKSVIVSTYADMIAQATGSQILIFGVTYDTVNMGGGKGAYIYIPSFGIGQIAINFI